MKKVLGAMATLVVAMVTVIVVLSALSSSGHAGPPTNAEGQLLYVAYPAGEPEIAGGNTFLRTTEVATWTGSFEGNSTDVCKVVIHSSGAWLYRGMGSLEGVVGDKEGTLEMLLVGNRPDGLSDWEGTWRITGGTDELGDLHGQGTFWGPGAAGFGVQGVISYTGRIHFDPQP
jgi:hypothetical protein